MIKIPQKRLCISTSDFDSVLIITVYFSDKLIVDTILYYRKDIFKYIDRARFYKGKRLVNMPEYWN